VEGFEKGLGHLLSVGFRVLRSFRKESWMLFRGNSEFVEEGMMPDSFHIIPVADDTVTNGVLKVKDTSLDLGLITDVGFLVIHTNHEIWLLGSSYDSRETAYWSIMTSNTSFALTGTVINNNCSLIFSHCIYNRIKIIKIIYIISTINKKYSL
jgi:hypothetical protein